MYIYIYMVYMVWYILFPKGIDIYLYAICFSPRYSMDFLVLRDQRWIWGERQTLRDAGILFNTEVANCQWHGSTHEWLARNWWSSGIPSHFYDGNIWKYWNIHWKYWNWKWTYWKSWLENDHPIIRKEIGIGSSICSVFQTTSMLMMMVLMCTWDGESSWNQMAMETDQQ